MNGVEALADILRDPANVPWIGIVVVVVLGFVTASALTWLLPRVAEALPSRWRIHLLTAVPALRLIIGFLVLIWVIPRVISPTTENLIAVLGAVGIAVGFAFKDYVSSLVAGIVAVAERPYRQGDWVQVGEHYGEVRSVGNRAFEIVTLQDDVVTVPHSVLWTSAVANANDGARTLMVVTDLWIDPDHDARAVRERLHEVAWTSPFLDVTRPVSVPVQDEPWGSRYRLKAYPLDARDEVPFATDLTVRGKEALRAMGCRFATAPVAMPSGRGGGGRATLAEPASGPSAVGGPVG
jgi:small conductance mechanosensitive channel